MDAIEKARNTRKFYDVYIVNDLLLKLDEKEDANFIEQATSVLSRIESDIRNTPVGTKNILEKERLFEDFTGATMHELYNRKFVLELLHYKEGYYCRLMRLEGYYLSTVSEGSFENIRKHLKEIEIKEKRDLSLEMRALDDISSTLL